MGAAEHAAQTAKAGHHLIGNQQDVVSGKHRLDLFPIAGRRHDNATRAQLAVIFYRMEGSPKVEGKNSFTDVEYGPGTAWYYDAVTWAEQSGVVGGYDNGKFGPGDPVTREQLAAIFLRLTDC